MTRLTKWTAVSAVFIVGGIIAWRVVSKQTKSQRVVHVPVAMTRERIETTIEATGVVGPRNRIEIKPPIGGRIEDVLVVEGQQVQQGDVLAWMSSTDRAALLDAARAQGEEALRKWSDVYRATPLLAPAAGTIIARKAEPGQTLTASDVAFVLSDRLIVRAQVDETDIGLIRIGQTVTMTLDAYPTTRFTGNVAHIAYEAKTINNVTMYEVEVTPQNAPDFMKSGMTATCRLVAQSAENALTLPVEAIVREDGQSFVLLAPRKPGAEPERRLVKTGLSGSGRIQILEGLDERDRVVRKTFDLPGRKPTKVNPFMPRPPGGRR